MNPENGHLTVAVQGNLDHEGTNEFTLTIRAENDRATPAGTPDEVSNSSLRIYTCMSPYSQP